MPAIFISHSSRDRLIADEITRSLKERLRFEEVFLDFDSDTGIGAGADWEKTLYEKLVRCHALLLILTQNWLASTWCRIELAQARALGKVILPVICEPLGERYVLPEIQAVEIIDWNSDGLKRIETRLRTITSELARGFKFDPSRLPYPGIHAFEEDDAAIYFGRDEESRAVIEKLDARRTQGGARLLLIIGASGSGKSSLLKAGVLPQLARRGSDWILLPSVRPEKTPLEMLAKVIAQRVGKPEDWRFHLERLVSKDAVEHIGDLSKDLRIGEARSATVLLPIDQFEEIFTVTPAAESATTIKLLAALLAPSSGLPLMVLATGRSDVLEGLIGAGDLAQLTETYPLPLMPLDRVPRLITGPAEVAGINVDPGLPERIKQDVESPEALPLLAHTLWLLYQRGVSRKRLSLAEYDSLGDPDRKLNPIQNSVRLIADQTVGGPIPSEQNLTALRDAFVPHLVRVQLSDGKRVRQPALLSEIPIHSRELIGKLTEARLLITRAAESNGRAGDGKEKIVEVAHEALFKAWPVLDQVLTEEHAFLIDIERIRSAYDIWQQAAPDEKSAALLQGLLLARARGWLLKYPKRFVGYEAEPLRAFIAASATSADAAREREDRRKRWLFRAAIVAAVIFAAATVLTGWLYLQAEEARASANNQRKVAVAREIFALSQAEEGVNSECSLDLAVAAYDAAKLPSGIDLLPFEAAVRSTVARSRVERTLPLAVRRQATPSWRADASELALVDKAGKVWLWDPGANEPHFLSDPTSASSAEWLPGGRQLLVMNQAGLQTWDAASGQVVKSVAADLANWEDLRVDPAGEHALIWSPERGTALLDLATGTMQPVAPPTNVWRGYAWSPDGKRAAVGAIHGEVWIVVPADKKYFPLKHPEEIVSVAWSPDGKMIIVGLDSGRIWRWNAAAGNHEDTLDGHTNQVTALDFSPDGEKLVSVSWDHSMRIWDTHSWRSQERLTGHTAGIDTVRWSPASTRIASVGADNTVRIWTATSRSPETWFETAGWVWSVGWNSDGSALVAAADSEVIVRDNSGRVRKIASPNGQFYGGAWASTPLYAVIDTKRAMVIDGTTWSTIMEQSLNVGRTLGVSIAPNGSLMAVASTDGVLVLSVPGGDIRYGIPALSPAVAFSPDSKVLAIAPAGTSQIHLIDIAGGKKIQVLEGNSEGKATWALAWSPDGRSLAAGSDDAVARIWNLSSPEQPMLLNGHDGDVKGIAWNKTGDRLATASLDNTARIWEVKSGRVLAVLSGHTSGVRSVAWSPDGTKLATGAEDGTARLFPADFADVLAIARRQERAGLTNIEFKQCTGRIGLGRIQLDSTRHRPLDEQRPLHN